MKSAILYILFFLSAVLGHLPFRTSQGVETDASVVVSAFDSASGRVYFVSTRQTSDDQYETILSFVTEYEASQQIGVLFSRKTPVTIWDMSIDDGFALLLTSNTDETTIHSCSLTSAICSSNDFPKSKAGGRYGLVKANIGALFYGSDGNSFVGFPLSLVNSFFQLFDYSSGSLIADQGAIVSAPRNDYCMSASFDENDNIAYIVASRNPLGSSVVAVRLAVFDSSNAQTFLFDFPTFDGSLQQAVYSLALKQVVLVYESAEKSFLAQMDSNDGSLIKQIDYPVGYSVRVFCEGNSESSVLALIYSLSSKDDNILRVIKLTKTGQQKTVMLFDAPHGFSLKAVSDFRYLHEQELIVSAEYQSDSGETKSILFVRNYKDSSNNFYAGYMSNFASAALLTGDDTNATTTNSTNTTTTTTTSDTPYITDPVSIFFSETIGYGVSYGILIIVGTALGAFILGAMFMAIGLKTRYYLLDKADDY